MKTRNATIENEHITDAQVAAYLHHHSDFLEQHPELLQVLTPPSYRHDAPVVDMQRFMTDRLRGQISHLQQELGNLVFSCRDNMTAQSQVHEAVIRLLECTEIDSLIHIISADLQRLFAVDTVMLCLEADIAAFQDMEYTALHFIPSGTVRQLMGKSDVRLGALDAAMVFGTTAPLVASAALVRLSFAPDTREGILAFGVRHAEQFHSGQGTELLAFLGRIVALCLQRVWHHDGAA